MKSSSSSMLPLILSGVVVVIGIALLGTAAVFMLRPAADEVADNATSTPAETRVVIPTATIAPTNTTAPTATATVPVTATILAETATPAPSATPIPPTPAPAQPTAAQPTTKPNPTNTPTSVPPTSPPASSRIINPTFAVESATVGVNQKIWFTFSVTNASTTTSLPIGELGAVVFNSSGQNVYFQESWSGFELTPGQKLDHRDGVPGIGTAGTYTMRLTICYSAKSACAGGGEWEMLSPPVTVTIQ
jgi:hypothetical protein